MDDNWSPVCINWIVTKQACSFIWLYFL